METASLSLSPSISRYDPSWGSGVEGVLAIGGPGAGDARLNVVKESLFKGRERSKPTPESGRDGGAGAGDDGRLLGRKKEGVLMACMATTMCVW